MPLAQLGQTCNTSHQECRFGCQPWLTLRRHRLHQRRRPELDYMRSPQVGLLFICTLLLAAACMGKDDVPTRVPTVEPTAFARVQNPVRPTSTPAAAPTKALPTVASVQATPPSLIALEALNIRGGPGIEYPVVGALAQEGDAFVVGRAADTLWYRIECPAGLDVPECWVIGDDSFVRIEGGQASAAATDGVAVAVVPAPAVPTAAPLPTTTPCRIAAPSGWSAYKVAIGDTVWSVAVRHGVTMAELKDVNCLDDMLFAGDTIYVPVRSVSQVASIGTQNAENSVGLSPSPLLTLPSGGVPEATGLFPSQGPRIPLPKTPGQAPGLLTPTVIVTNVAPSGVGASIASQALGSETIDPCATEPYKQFPGTITIDINLSIHPFISTVQLSEFEAGTYQLHVYANRWQADCYRYYATIADVKVDNGGTFSFDINIEEWPVARYVIAVENGQRDFFAIEAPGSMP